MFPVSAVVFILKVVSVTLEHKLNEKKNQVREFKFKTACSAFKLLMGPNRAVGLACLNCGSVEDEVHCTALLLLKGSHFGC